MSATNLLIAGVTAHLGRETWTDPIFGIADHILDTLEEGADTPRPDGLIAEATEHLGRSTWSDPVFAMTDLLLDLLERRYTAANDSHTRLPKRPQKSAALWSAGICTDVICHGWCLLDDDAPGQPSCHRPASGPCTICPS